MNDRKPLHPIIEALFETIRQPMSQNKEVEHQISIRAKKLIELSEKYRAVG